MRKRALGDLVGASLVFGAVLYLGYYLLKSKQDEDQSGAEETIDIEVELEDVDEILSQLALIEIAVDNLALELQAAEEPGVAEPGHVWYHHFGDLEDTDAFPATR